jgi:hypothetical protein
MGLILTFGARFIIVETDTGKQSDGAVEESNHAGKWDVFGFFDQVVATSFALFTTEVACFAELEEYVFEKLMRNTMFFGYVLNQDGLIFPMLTEVSEGMQGVLGLFGKHDQK